MGSSFRILRVRGIDIGANWSWLLIFAFILWTLANRVFPPAYPGMSSSTYWAMAITAGVLFVASLLLHELGHAFRAQREGMEIDGITLWLFGGVARFKGMFPTAGAELRIAIAGPLVTVALIVIYGVVWLGLGFIRAPAAVIAVFDLLWQINLSLLVFNMIPALPLDGGRVLRSILWQRRGDFTTATVSAARIARIIAGGFIGFGILRLLTPEEPFGGLWISLIGWFLLQAAQAELSYALFRQSLSGILVRHLMTREPESVDPDRSIASFIDDVARLRGHSTYPVIDGDELVGLISLRLAAQVPVPERESKTVRDMMVLRDQLPVLGPDDDVTTAAEVMQTGMKDGARRALVLDPMGGLAGILSMADIARAIEVEQIRKQVPKQRRSRARWILIGAALLAAAAFLYAPPFVRLAPGKAFDVTKDITIKGVPVDRVDGEYLLTSVAVQQPNVYGFLAAILGGEQLAPLSAVVPAGVDQDEFFTQQEALFAESQTTAAAAAAMAAGMKVELKGTGASVASVTEGAPAARVLKSGDVITTIDGKRVSLAEEVSTAIRKRPSGSTFKLGIEREKKKRTVEVRSRAGIVEGGGPGIGVMVATRDFDYKLPFEITFRDREIGGPSAGLAYALAVYDLIEKSDLAAGRIVATTGTVDREGRVGPIGGIDQKAIAAERAKAELFLVPAEEVALAKGTEVEIVGVRNLRDAIEALRGRS